MQTGRKILNLRCDRKVTQQELAESCDITPSALSKIEAGINSPRASVLWRIASKLGVTVEYLLDESMPYPYPGHDYRRETTVEGGDAESMVRMEVTRGEKAFLEDLRQRSEIAREIAMSIPSASVEMLRLVHFLLNHSRIENPSRDFLTSFESLVTTGSLPVPDAEEAKPRRSSTRGAAAKKRGRPRGAAASSKSGRRAGSKRSSTRRG